jgi:UDP-glucose 4-epimerase
MLPATGSEAEGKDHVRFMVIDAWTCERNQPSMAVVVTGAHGFVGLNVVRHLAANGITAIAVGRAEPDAWVTAYLEDVSEHVSHVRADLSVPGSLASATGITGVEAVVHAAVVTATTPQVERDDALRIVSVNIGGTMEAIDLARATGAKRFVYVSSPSAIGYVSSGTLVDESVPKRPDSLYGITKDASEELVRRYGKIHDLSVASVRIAQPYGPGERATSSRLRTSPIYEWMLAAERGERLITGAPVRGRDWTYIDDTARGLVTVALADELQHDLYHLARSERVTIAAVVSEIRKAMRIKLDSDLDNPDLNPNISGPAERRPLDTSRFREEFGWAPETDIVEGMARYIEWWKSFQPAAYA